VDSTAVGYSSSTAQQLPHKPEGSWLESFSLLSSLLTNNSGSVKYCVNVYFDYVVSLSAKITCRVLRYCQWDYFSSSCSTVYFVILCLMFVCNSVYDLAVIAPINIQIIRGHTHVNKWLIFLETLQHQEIVIMAYAVMRCPSVRQSRSCILSKRINIFNFFTIR